MSSTKKSHNKASKKKLVEAERTTRNKLRLAIVLTSIGGLLLIVGLFLGRGSASGSALFNTRFFLLVLGVSLLLVGIVGLLAHVLVQGANKQVNRSR